MYSFFLKSPILCLIVFISDLTKPGSAQISENHSKTGIDGKNLTGTIRGNKVVFVCLFYWERIQKFIQMGRRSNFPSFPETSLPFSVPIHYFGRLWSVCLLYPHSSTEKSLGHSRELLLDLGDWKVISQASQYLTRTRCPLMACVLNSLLYGLNSEIGLRTTIKKKLSTIFFRYRKIFMLEHEAFWTL